MNTERQQSLRIDKMDMDLFVSLNHNKFNDVVKDLEIRVEALFASRHIYPIWPMGDGPLDDYDREIYAPIRHIYYQSTIILIQALRSLKELA